MMKISLWYPLLLLTGAIASSAYAETPALPPVPLTLPTLPAPVQLDKNAVVATPAVKEVPAQADAKAAPVATTVVVPAQVTAVTVETPAVQALPAQADANAGQKTATVGAAAPAAKIDTLAKALPGWKGSLMFTAAEIKMVQEALDSVGADAEVDNTPQRSDVPMASSSKNFMSDIAANLAPTYYLNSILYISPSNWTVWVNGVQYSAELHGFDSEALKGLMVEHISPQAVRFTSRIRLLDRIAPGWKEKFSIDEKGNFVSINIKNLTVSKEKDVISFTLQPNQRFAVSTMEINEGMLP